MKRASRRFVLLLALMGSACLAVFTCLASFLGIISFAERVYGSPYSELDMFQHLYISTKLVLEVDSLTRPIGGGPAERPFSIGLGESTFSITERLQAEGLIPDAAALRDYLVYKGMDKTMQAGAYQIKAEMTPIDLARALQDATPETVVFHILPGWRMEEIAASLATSGLQITPDALMEGIQSRPVGYDFPEEIPSKASFEGFLFPGAYEFSRTISTNEFIVTILKNFESKLNDDLRRGFSEQGLSVFQAVTLASIVQREAMLEEEMPAIASVFYNRLAQGMRLDSDPTIQYALGYNSSQKTWWTNPLSRDDLEFVSSYNTYQNTGLPPGPISNPGLPALSAVAHPAKTTYYYFRAACDGSGRHTFAHTFEEHLNNGCP